MNEREPVPGYIDPMDEERKLQQAISKGAKEVAELRSRLQNELACKIELTQHSTAPFDCMVEQIGKRGIFTKRQVIIAKRPAWYLGEWQRHFSDEYGGGFFSYHFALVPGYRDLIFNDTGIGKRQEFRQGFSSGMHGPMVYDIEALRAILELPGWKELIENQPEEGES